MSLLLQQRSIVRYFVLRGKSNQQITAKLAKGYGRDALCLRAVEKWAVRFHAGQHDVEDDDRSGQPLKRIFAILFSVFLRKPALFIARCQQGALYPENNNSPSIHWLGLRFYKAGWIPHRPSEEQKVDRVTLRRTYYK
jgi:hypothetical protein